MTWYDMFELKMNFHMNFQLVLLEIEQMENGQIA